ELPGQGPALVAGAGAAAGARPARVPAALPAPAQGARGDGEGRPAAGARGRAVPHAEALRIVLLDPPSFTAPYDHALASALARRGPEVTLLPSPFTHGDVPEPHGYVREEVFLPWSSRLLRRSPRARTRVVLKGLEYGPSAVRLLRRVRALRPDVVHVQ